MNAIDTARDFILSKLSTHHRPTIGLTLGSGLGELAEQIESPLILPYESIPGFAHSTAPGHKGRMVIGTLSGKVVCCMQGRLHYYEGHAMEDIIFPVRVMREIGVRTLILTNAAGGLHPDFAPGDLMLITDHINFLGTNPLIGKNDERFGPRFSDMTYCYAPALQEVVRKAAANTGISLREGVYLATTGPSFETPAEIRAFRALGANAVGMSTVPEAIAASHAGMGVIGISCIANLGAGMLDIPLSGDDVLTATTHAGEAFRTLLAEAVRLCP